MAFTTLILDAPGPPLLFEEVDRFLELGLVVTLNLHYFADKDRIRQHYATRIHYAEINCHDEPAFIAAVTQAGGYSVFKTRLNIPFGASLIRAATSPALATPLRAIAQAGTGVNHIDRLACEQCGVAILNTPGSNAPLLPNTSWPRRCFCRATWMTTTPKRTTAIGQKAAWHLPANTPN